MSTKQTAADPRSDHNLECEITSSAVAVIPAALSWLIYREEVNTTQKWPKQIKNEFGAVLNDNKIQYSKG